MGIKNTHAVVRLSGINEECSGNQSPQRAVLFKKIIMIMMKCVYIVIFVNVHSEVSTVSI
jgi:hypothetical protein